MRLHELAEGILTKHEHSQAEYVKRHKRAMERAVVAVKRAQGTAVSPEVVEETAMDYRSNAATHFA